MPRGAGKMRNHQHGAGGLSPFLEGMRLWKIHVKQLLGTFLPRGFYYVGGFFCLYVICRNVLPSSLYILPAPSQKQLGQGVDEGWEWRSPCPGSHGPRVLAVLSPWLSRSRVWEPELSLMQCLCSLKQRKQILELTDKSRGRALP